MARLPALASPSELAAEQQSAAEAVLKVFGHIRGPFSMLLHSPRLAQQLLPLVTFVREANIVEPRLRFAAILTAVRESRAEYVWAAQVEQARKNGMREDFIDALRSDADAAKLSPEEHDVVAYVRQLLRSKRVDQATFERLERKYSAQWLVELTAIVNFFVFVSGICNAFEVPAPAGGDKLPPP